MMRHVAWKAGLVGMLLLAGIQPVYAQTVNNRGGVKVDHPYAAARGDIIRVTVTTGWAHEEMAIHATNLRLRRAWMDHCGFNTGWSCLQGDQIINNCSAYPYTLSCEWYVSHEWSPSWYGAPTWEFEVVGCGESEIYVTYLGPSHECCYQTPTTKMIILGGTQADFSASPATACKGEDVVFTDTSCGGKKQTWSFGDGRAGSGKIVSHAYADPGTYSATLTVTDGFSSSTKTKAVTVAEDCGAMAGNVAVSWPGQPLDGAPLAGTDIAISGTGGSRKANSGISGNYSVKLPIGTYSATASLMGYLPATATGIFIQKDQTTGQNFALALDPNPPPNNASLLGNHPNNVSDPVNPAIGNFAFEETLFQYPGKGLAFRFAVSYNSLDNQYNGPLGFGWTHSYNIVLTKNGNVATIRWGDGHQEFFQYDSGAGTYSPLDTRTNVKLINLAPGGYEATLPGGTRYQFDAFGRLVKIIDLNSNQLVLVHSTGLDRITDTGGREVQFTYLNGRLSSLSGPLVSYAFVYDGDGNLTGITDPRGNSFHFTYDGTHRMLTCQDRAGVVTVRNTYDAQGRVVEQRDAEDRPTAFEYFGASSITQVKITPPSGNAVYHYYDTGSNLIRVVDGEGHEAQFAYDGGGQFLGAIDMNGGKAAFSYDGAGNMATFTNRKKGVWQFSYNTLNRPTRVVGPGGAATEMGYDAKGNMTRFQDTAGGQTSVTYTASGQPEQVTTPRMAQWQYTYFPEGRLKTQEAPSGETTSYAYDGAGRPTQVVLPNGGTWQFSYDANGNLLSRKDPLDQVTEYSYDGNNNVTGRTFVPSGAATRYDYDGLGQLIKVTDALGGETVYAYDGDGNLTSVKDPDGVTVSYQYDKSNRMVGRLDPNGQLTQYGYDGNGNRTTVQNPLGQVWTTRFNEEGQGIEFENPAGGKSLIEYNSAGVPTKRVDAGGQESYPMYDTEGRPMGGILSDWTMISYQRDLTGRITQATDGLGRKWSFSYDTMGRFVSRTDPNGKGEAFEYNAMGRLTKRTARSGEVTAYSYDVGGRLIREDLPGGAAATYGYDTAGRLSSMTDGSGTITLAYDKLGRLVSRTDPFGRAMAYTYTAAGRLAALTYPGNKAVTYTYDTAGRRWKVTDWLGHQTVYQYDVIGRAIRIDLPNGTRQHMTYDQRGSVSALRHEKSDGTVFASHDLTRDPTGRIASMSRTGGPAVTFGDTEAAFSYDAVNRLVSGQADGNPVAYLYDQNGNLTAKTSGGITTLYAYDGSNRLVSVNDGTQTTAYGYDARGNRIEKIRNGNVTRYLGDDRRTYGAYDIAGAVSRFHIYGDRLLYTLDGSGDILVLHNDERGSVTAVTDATQNVLQTVAYDPYGKILASSGGQAPEWSFVGTLGVMRDENGLYHMKHRFYDPETRRFLTEDPLGISGGLHLYAYSRNDPINRIDPKGLQAEVLFSGITIPPPPAGITAVRYFELFESLVRTAVTGQGAAMTQAEAVLLEQCGATQAAYEVAVMGEEAGLIVAEEAIAGETVMLGESVLVTSAGETAVMGGSEVVAGGISAGTAGSGGLTFSTAAGPVAISFIGGIIVGRAIGNAPIGYDAEQHRYYSTDEALTKFWAPAFDTTTTDLDPVLEAQIAQRKHILKNFGPDALKKARNSRLMPENFDPGYLSFLQGKKVY